MKFKEQYVIIVIVIIAFLIRLLFLHSVPVKYWDETVYIDLGYDLSKNPAAYSFSHGWTDFTLFDSSINAGFRPPVLPYILAGVYALHLEFLIDYLLPLLGALTVLLVYILASHLFDKKVGIYSATLLAFLPIHEFFSARVMNDVLATFLLLLTIIFFWKGFEEEKRGYKYLFGLFLAITILTRYTILWTIPIFFIYRVIRKKSLRFLLSKDMLLSEVIFLLALSPWLLYGLKAYGDPLGPFKHGLQAASYWGGTQHWYFFFQYWWEFFSILGILFTFSLMWIIYKKEYLKKEIYFLLLWIAIFLAFSLTIPHKEDRFIIPVLPALAIISAATMTKLPFKKTILVVSTIILLLATASLYTQTRETLYNTNTACFLQINDYLQKVNGDYVTISESSPMWYYFTHHPSFYYPEINSSELKMMARSKNVPVYFVFTRYNSALESSEVEHLREILAAEYKFEYACPDDPELNFVYSYTPQA